MTGRLIDADRLLQGYEDHDFIDTHIIWNAPTVEAIPVEFIKRQIDGIENNGIKAYSVIFGDYAVAYKVLIKAWEQRKEDAHK